MEAPVNDDRLVIGARSVEDVKFKYSPDVLARLHDAVGLGTEWAREADDRGWTAANEELARLCREAYDDLQTRLEAFAADVTAAGLLVELGPLTVDSVDVEVDRDNQYVVRATQHVRIRDPRVTITIGLDL
jgi:hypothetical protein